MPNIGPVELVIILVIALLIIGPGKLPDVGSALGKSIREFRKAATDVQESVKLDAPAPVAQSVPAAPAAPVAQSVPAAPAASALPPIEAAAVPTEPVPAPDIIGNAANPSAPPPPDPAATAADAATEARV